LNLTSVVVTGIDFARVTPSIGSPPNCGASVAPMGSCQVAIQCSPSAIGVRMGQVAITHNATGSPTNVVLTCNGNPLPVSTIVLPGRVDFGDQVVNTTSAAQTVNIANTGTAPMSVSAIALSGPNAANFAVSGMCGSVAAGANCPVLLTFTPNATGAKSATLNVTSDAQNAATVNAVALGGTGVLAPRPIASLSLTAIGYGNSIFGGASTSQTVLLKNDGGLPLTIQSIVATGDYTVAHNCGSSIASLASCTINVFFVPTALGGRGGELQVFSNAQGSPHLVQLTGTGCRWFSQAGSRFYLTSC
jgi:hypothetical protein